MDPMHEFVLCLIAGKGSPCSFPLTTPLLRMNSSSPGFFGSDSSDEEPEQSAAPGENTDEGYDSGAAPTERHGDASLTEFPTVPSRHSASELESLSYEGELDCTIGRYRLEERIGQGAFGVVYRALDEILERYVALKLLTRFQSVGEVNEWLEEARMLAALDHASIVPVFDVGKTDGGQPFIVSKLIEGGSLAQRATKDTWTLADTNRTITQLARALHYLHGRGTMHRDIKPTNILITKDGDAILVDFGLALPERGFGRGARFVGTPAYMSPEQARHEGHRVDGRSDIYSLGVVFYELLTGKRPFHDSNKEQLLDCIRNVEVRPPRQLNGTIPRELERICLKALSKKISDRYSTAGDMAEELEQWDAGDLSLRELSKVRLDSVDLPETVTTARSLDLDSIAVVPHGLRPFDSNDADFFRFLIAGVRDRQGIPESITFWTKSILSRVVDSTFRVGVLLGPSGSGKSSLMKAGVIPLVENYVSVVYVDAKPEALESTLAKQIRHIAGSLPVDGSLVDMLVTLRAMGGTRSRKKLLIVIDQFEQWLNHHRTHPSTVLKDALRQCDGVTVQAILIVRDDFVLGVSSFMDQLEESLEQNTNFAMVEPFGESHAKNVLTAFGRAYGAIAEPPTQAQAAFVDEAIRGFSAMGRIDPLQIALLSEMTKGKPWSPSTLKQLGGIEGLGVAFLEEKLSGASAHPILRTNEVVVRRLLSELLPSDSTTIKPPAILQSELLDRMEGLATEETLQKLLQLLDTEVRLITPTSSMRSVSGSQSGSSTTDPAYQLTHDYLVLTTRNWLAIHESETRAGRVREQLREIAASWSARPIQKRLPTLAEWLAIRWFIPQRRWTATESRMMQAANRRWFRNGAMVGGGLLLLGVIASFVATQLHARNLSKSLANIDTSEVVELLHEVEQYRRSWIFPIVGLPVASLPNDASGQSRAKFHFALANADQSTEDANDCLDHLHDIEDADLPSILGFLSRTPTIDNQQLADKVEAEMRLRSPNALPLTALLAHRAPDLERWPELMSSVSQALIREPVTRLNHWAGLLSPLRRQLVGPLSALGERMASDPKGVPEILIGFMAAFASDSPSDLAHATAWAGTQRMLPLLRSTSTQELASELRRELTRLTDPRALESALPKDLQSRLAAWGGMQTPNGGWSDSIPAASLLDTVKAMREAHFVPSSIRVSSSDKPLTFSVTWIPAESEVDVAIGLSRDEMMEKFASAQLDGWRMMDFACIESRGPGEDGSQVIEATWLGLWHRDLDQERVAQTLRLSVSTEETGTEAWRELKRGAKPMRYETRVDEWGDLVVDVLFEEFTSDSLEALRDEPSISLMVSDVELMAGDRYPGYQLNDVRDIRVVATKDRGSLWNDFESYSLKFLEFRERLKQVIDDPSPDPNRLQTLRKDTIAAFVNMLSRLSMCGDQEQAIELLEKYSNSEFLQGSENSVGMLRLKGTILARSQQERELTAFMSSELDAGGLSEEEKGLLRLRQALLRGETNAALEELEGLEAADIEMSRGRTLENQLRGLALVTAHLQGTESIQPMLDRLIAKAEMFLEREGSIHSTLLDCDFDGVRRLGGWIAMLDKHRLSHRISMAYSEQQGWETKLLFQLDPAEHRRQAEQWMADRYVPSALVWHVVDGKKQRLTSQWTRETRSMNDEARRARAVAAVILAMAHLGRMDELTQGLEERWGRSVQTSLVHSLSQVLTASAIIKLLQGTASVPLQAGLLSALGEIPWGQIDEASQRYMVARLPDLMRASNDPYLANMAKWLAESWSLSLPETSIGAGAFNRNRWSINSVGQQMVRLSGPEFVLSKQDSLQQQRVAKQEEGATSRKVLRVWLKLGREYQISSTEVSSEQFREFLEDPKVAEWLQTELKEGSLQLAKSNMPQNNISWSIAVRYCQWLNERESIPEDQWCYRNVWSNALGECQPNPNYLARSGYRLPTLAEWQWACSGGSAEPWHFGSDESEISMFEWTVPHSGEVCHPVGRLRPNAFGLFDMGGNLAEWTDTQYAPPLRMNRFYVSDGGNREPLAMGKADFILCGGRYRFVAQSAITHSMVRDYPSYQSATTGFRVARTLILD
jgi:serine/threonine protein kinase/formylglycine-generating enzyme required for sulfatase activity